MWILAMVGKICSAVFFFAAWWCYKAPKSTPDSTTDYVVKNTCNIATISATELDLNHVIESHHNNLDEDASPSNDTTSNTPNTEARDSRLRWYKLQFKITTFIMFTYDWSSCFIDKFYRQSVNLSITLFDLNFQACAYFTVKQLKPINI